MSIGLPAPPCLFRWQISRESGGGAPGRQRPFQTGSRFSAKARAPSSWSSEE